MYKIFLVVCISLILVGCIGSKHQFKRKVFSKEWYLYSVTINDSSIRTIDSLGKYTLGFKYTNVFMGYDLCIRDNNLWHKKKLEKSARNYYGEQFSWSFREFYKPATLNVAPFIRPEYHCTFKIFKDPIFSGFKDGCMIFYETEGTLRLDRDSLIIDLKPRNFTPGRGDIKSKIVCIDRNSIK